MTRGHDSPLKPPRAAAGRTQPGARGGSPRSRMLGPARPQPGRPRQTLDTAAAPASAGARHKKQISQFVQMLLAAVMRDFLALFLYRIKTKVSKCVPQKYIGSKQWCGVCRKYKWLGK